MTEPTDMQSPESAEPRQHSLTARILAAVGFSTIGAKIGLVGLVFDANHVFKGEKIPLGQKFRQAFNGEMFQKLSANVEKVMAEKNIGQWRAVGGEMKYWLILSTIGTVAGGVIGWIRGGLIENWKDIFKHPIQSTEIVFGLKQQSPDQPQTEFAGAQQDRWQRSVAERAPVQGGSYAEKVRQQTPPELTPGL